MWKIVLLSGEQWQEKMDEEEDEAIRSFAQLMFILPLTVSQNLRYTCVPSHSETGNFPTK